MRSILFLSVLAGLAVPAAPALAQDAAADVRCLLASNAFAGLEKDPARKQLAIQSAHFFLGRVDARLTPAQLKAQILQETKTLTPQTITTAMNACVQRLQARQRMIQDLGKDIVANAPKPAAPPAK